MLRTIVDVGPTLAAGVAMWLAGLALMGGLLRLGWEALCWGWGWGVL